MTTKSILIMGLTTLLGGSALATVPIPDLVLYGRVYQADGTQITSDLSASTPEAPTITVKLEGATGPGDPPIAETSTLHPTNNPTLGELYVLRIRRENGATQTMENHVVSGDRIHIYVDDVEVAETSFNLVIVAGSPSEVVRLNLNDPAPVGGGFDNFVALFGLTGEDATREADKDGDRIDNFREWIYGLDPTIADGAGRLPVVGVRTDAGNDRFLTLTYVRRNDAPELVDIVQLSGDLRTWDGSEAEIMRLDPPVDLGNGTEQVTAWYMTPLDAAPQPLLFIRVEFAEVEP